MMLIKQASAPKSTALLQRERAEKIHNVSVAVEAIVNTLPIKDSKKRFVLAGK